ncbi:MAG: hypothetical protein WC789_10005 [Lentisphaeria bacterium]|jgi:hypothetical protein
MGGRRRWWWRRGVGLAVAVVAWALMAAESAMAADTSVKAWPLLYRARDAVSGEVRTELLWPLSVAETTPHYQAWQFLSWPQEFPAHYPRQAYFLWPLSGWRGGAGTDAWLFPLLWYKETGERGHFTVFPLLWTCWEKELGLTRLHLFPVYGYRHGRDSTAHHLLLLAGTERGTRADGTAHAAWWLWPLLDLRGSDGPLATTSSLWLLPYWRERGEFRVKDQPKAPPRRTATDLLFPVWWSWADTAAPGAAGDLRGRFLFPFGGMGEKRGEWSTLNVLGPVYHRHTDFQTGITQRHFLFPFGYQETVLGKPSPAGIRGEPVTTAWRLAPLAWQRKGEHTVVAPAWWDFRHGGGTARTLNIAGLQHNEWRGGDSWHFLFPLAWWFRQESLGLTSAGVVPAAWYVRTAAGDRYRGVLLASWSDHPGNPNRTHLAFWPLYARSRMDEGSRSRQAFWLLPFYRSTLSDLRAPAGAPPLATTAALWPFYLAHAESAADGSRAGYRVLPPFWWEFQRRPAAGAAAHSRYLLPLGAVRTVAGRSRQVNVLGPVFNRAVDFPAGSSRTDVLWPLVKREAGPGGQVDARFPPFAGWSYEPGRAWSAWYAFPIVWTHERAESARRWQAAVPLWWRDRSAREDWSLFLPFYWRERGPATIPASPAGRGPAATLPRTTTVVPLLLGRTRVDARATRHDYLLSMLAWGRGEESRLVRVFPFASVRREGGSRSAWGVLPPYFWEKRRGEDGFRRDAFMVPLVAGRHTETRADGTTERGHFALLHGAETRRAADGAVQRQENWLFPFYSYTADPGQGRRRLEVLGPVWTGEWERGEARLRGLGGLSSFHERDVNGFADTRLLYRLYRGASRSWVEEQEWMLFFNRRRTEDGARSWNVLGGLFGAGADAAGSYVRLFFLPLRTGGPAPAAGPAAAAMRERHAEFALQYLKSRRFDRAALEFALAGGARAEDAAFQFAAGQAYLAAEANPGRLRADLERGGSLAAYQTIKGAGAFQAETVRRNLRQAARQRFERVRALGRNDRELRLALARTWERGAPERLALFREQFAASGTVEDAVALVDEAFHDLPAWGARTPGRVDAARKALAAELAARFPSSPDLQLLALRTREELPDEMQAAAEPGTLPRAAAAYEAVAALPAAPAGGDGQAVGLAWMSGMVAAKQGWGGAAVDARAAAAEIAQGLLIRWLGLRPAAAGAEFAQVRERMLRLAALAPAAEGVGALAEHAVRNRDYAGLDRLAAWVAAQPAARRWRHEGGWRYGQAWQRAAWLNRWQVALTLGGAESARPAAVRMTVDDPAVEYVDLAKLGGGGGAAVAVAECVVVSDRARAAVLRLGFDEELEVELNGAAVFGPKRSRVALRDDVELPVRLQAGANRLVLRLANRRLGFGFFARLTDGAGRRLEGVRFELGPAVQATLAGRETGLGDGML